MKISNPLLAVLVLSLSLNATESRAQSTSPPYASSVAMMTPEIFGEGVISTGNYELTTTFTPDGQTAYYSVSTPRYGNFYTILVSRFEEGAWSTPEVASFSGQYSDADAFISPDGTELYYLSTRPVEGTEPKEDFDIWKVERQGGGWGDPIHLGTAVNSDRHELYPTVTAEGTLYFTAFYDDSHGRADLYRSRLVDGQYTSPENLGAPINTEHYETTPYVAPDERYVIFSVWHPEGYGSGDLYISYNRDGTWTTPKNLGAPINTTAKEYCPIVSPDGRYLFFSSDRGFGDEDMMEEPLDYPTLLRRLGRAGNSLGDVYQVDLQAVLQGEQER